MAARPGSPARRSRAFSGCSKAVSSSAAVHGTTTMDRMLITRRDQVEGGREEQQPPGPRRPGLQPARHPAVLGGVLGAARRAHQGLFRPARRAGIRRGRIRRGPLRLRSPGRRHQRVPRRRRRLARRRRLGRHPDPGRTSRRPPASSPRPTRPVVPVPAPAPAKTPSDQLPSTAWVITANGSASRSPGGCSPCQVPSSSEPRSTPASPGPGRSSSWPCCVAGCAVLLITMGLGTVEIRDGTLRAGGDVLPLTAVSEVVCLDEKQTTRLRGPRADPAARLYSRPYLKEAVYLAVDAVEPGGPLLADRHQAPGRAGRGRRKVSSAGRPRTSGMMARTRVGDGATRRQLDG